MELLYVESKVVINIILYDAALIREYEQNFG